jgi:hypothetical protein
MKMDKKYQDLTEEEKSDILLDIRADFLNKKEK